MTENEKKLIQAKHRLEEAQMRSREKERKAGTCLGACLPPGQCARGVARSGKTVERSRGSRKNKGQQTGP